VIHSMRWSDNWKGDAMTDMSYTTESICVRDKYYSVVVDWESKAFHVGNFVPADLGRGETFIVGNNTLCRVFNVHDGVVAFDVLGSAYAGLPPTESEPSPGPTWRDRPSML